MVSTMEVMFPVAERPTVTTLLSLAVSVAAALLTSKVSEEL